MPLQNYVLDAPATPLVNLGWNSNSVNLHVVAVEMKAWSPEKFMDVCDQKVADVDGVLSSSM